MGCSCADGVNSSAHQRRTPYRTVVQKGERLPRQPPRGFDSLRRRGGHRANAASKTADFLHSHESILCCPELPPLTAS
jgi:hypothetical protein